MPVLIQNPIVTRNKKYDQTKKKKYHYNDKTVTTFEKGYHLSSGKLIVPSRPIALSRVNNNYFDYSCLEKKTGLPYQTKCGYGFADFSIEQRRTGAKPILILGASSVLINYNFKTNFKDLGFFVKKK